MIVVARVDCPYNCDEPERCPLAHDDCEHCAVRRIYAADLVELGLPQLVAGALLLVGGWIFAVVIAWLA